MKCKDCGLEVANIGELNKHKKICPNEPGDEKTETPPSNEIPLHLLPDEIKYLGPGKYIGVRFQGRLTATGMEVHQKELVR